MDLHVFIEVFGPPCEAYALMAHAMEEVKKFLVPDMMDDICQEQFLELSYLNGVPEPTRGRGLPVRGRGAVPPPPPVPSMALGLIMAQYAKPSSEEGYRSRRSLSATRQQYQTRQRYGSGQQPVRPKQSKPGKGRGVGPPPPPPRGALVRGAPVRGAIARGAAVARGVPPLPAGYDDAYAEQSYEGYEGYYSQGQQETEYYDYGHGEAQESYEAYGQDDWNGTRPSLKAPPARPVKGAYREHPYGRY
ncbi:UNVERIFIED_CONTAM: KH domain-containing, RNA-binding, signal transduction-associated protein 1 [Gekko kuhli]